MDEIVFVTQNKGKIASANREFQGVNFTVFEHDLIEPRSADVKEISKQKVLQAYEIVKKPCISNDSGFYVDALNGFPNTYVNHCLSTIGIEGILKLMEDKEDRTCCFKESLSYYDGENLYQFDGLHLGEVSKAILGNDTDKKWSDLWYIYIPKGKGKTLAELGEYERSEADETSISSFAVFAKWYKENKL